MKRAACIGVALAALSTPARAADVPADPTNYRDLLGTLQPGDTMHLAAGTYTDTLPISGVNGGDAAWITITGPESGNPAVILADPGPCCNTIEISDSSYLVLRKLTIDGNNVDGAFGISANGGLVHHIRIEDNELIHHDTSQQNVGISTKVPTWGWEIRRNRIVGVGTGLYLGNSDGSEPFIGGLIEHNLVKDSIGYSMQIKWQLPRPSVPGMPTDPVSTIVRHNVFIKNDGPSPDGDRPNLLVGGFPDTGPGSQDRYEIYGNFFFHNPRESLLQVSGRVSVHDNIFVDGAVNAITATNHDLPLMQAYIYNNTIYSTNGGIVFSNAAPQGDAVFGNLIFAASPIGGTIADERDNLTAAVADAAQHVTAPSLTLGQMDFYPLVGACQGSALDVSKVTSDVDHDVDFNGTPKAGFTFRGAYAGEGQNPGWQLTDDIKEGGGMGTGGGASAAATSGAGGGGPSSGAGAAENGFDPENDDAGGCGCHTHGSNASPIWLLALLPFLRRRANQRRHTLANHGCSLRGTPAGR